MKTIASSLLPGEVALKIYGERNTGTNYLTSLFERNLRARILAGRVDDRDVLTQLTRRLHRFMPALTHSLHEAARDRFFEATFPQNLGWKHMNPDIERIGPEALAAVRFLMVVKNPYSWLLSLYQRPYHIGAKDVCFEDFLNRHLGVMQKRENIGPDPLSPVEVWNFKMRGYQALLAAAPHAMIVRYEDFLTDEFAALGRVARALEVPLRETYEPADAGIKQRDHDVTQKDYADYYLNERWRGKLTARALQKINATLDPALVTQLGYQMISSTAAPPAPS